MSIISDSVQRIQFFLKGLDRAIVSIPHLFYRETFQSGDSTDISGASPSRTDKVIGWIFWSIGVVFCFLAASLVANHLISQPWQIRLFAFLFVFIGSLLSSAVLSAVLIYYIFFIFSRVYYNSTIPDDLKATNMLPLLPTLFTFLPLTTVVPKSWSLQLFYAPFSYDPTIPYISNRLAMEENVAIDNAKNSFHSFEKVVQIGGFKELFEQWTDAMTKMHRGAPAPAPALAESKVQ